MLKRILKKTLCSVLAIVMVATSFSIFDPSTLFPSAQAAITSDLQYPDAYIVVPETLYLTPSLSASTTVQYYVNDTLVGTAVTPDEARDAATGKFWFNVSEGTVTDLQYSIMGTNKRNVPISAGPNAVTLSDVTLDVGLNAADVQTLEWIFTCRIDGKSAEYHAFSVAYAPYYTPVGAAANAKHGFAGTQMQGITWISGVHGCQSSDTTPAAGEDNDNYVISNYHARKVNDTANWIYPLVPMIMDIPAPANNDQNIADWLSTSTTDACEDASFTLYDVDKNSGGAVWDKKSMDVATHSHYADITVDVSRNHNFSTVPNVTTGFFVSDLKRNDKWMGSYGGYMANYAGEFPGIDFWFSRNHYYDGAGEFTATQGVDTDFFGGNTDSNNGTRYFTTDGIPYNGLWNRATPTAAGTYRNDIHTALCCEYGGNWIYMNLYLFINVTAVDKTQLREKVFRKQYQANAKALDNYAFVRDKLEAAYLALGDPTATQTAINSALAGLDSIDACYANTETVTATHVNQKTGEPFAASETEQLTIRRSDGSLIVAPNSYEGYSYTGTRRTYADATAYGIFDANAWAASACAANGSGVSSVEYDPASRAITVTNSDIESNTAYPVSNVLSSSYYCLAVEPSGTYTIDFDYAGASRGKIGVICYDEDGAYICSTWLFDSFKASGSTSVFRHHKEIFCAESNAYLFGIVKRFDVHYIVLTFGISAEESQSAAPAVFANVSVTPSNELFDLTQWNFRTRNLRSSTNAAGFSDKRYDSETKTLTLSSAKTETCTSYTTGNVLTANELSGNQYYPWSYMPVTPNTTYVIEGAYAGTGNGQITIAHYNTNGSFTGTTSLASAAADGGILAGSGSSTNFNAFYAPFTTKEDDGYVTLAFGGSRNPNASADAPVTNVFRDVKVHAPESVGKVYTLYYRPNVYTVCFDPNGGSGTMPDQRLTYNEAQALTANAFARPGYSFTGWAVSAGGEKVYTDGESVENLTVEADGSIVLYACWSADTYTIEYDAPGAAITGDYVTEYDVNTSITLPTAEKPGYTLTSWRADESGNWASMTYNVGQTVTGKHGNVKLTAVWRANTYSVAFNPNGGEGTAMANQSFVYGVSQTLTANAFTRVGYSFRGWALTAEAETALYTDKENVQDLTVEANAVVTLYAVWGANTYSILYTTDGGTIRDAEYTTGFTITDQIVLPQTVEKTGYAFNGWKSASSTGSWNVETTYTGTLNAGMIGNVTLQAQWKVQGYTISYDLGGGTFATARYTTAYNLDSAITLPNARRTGYTFCGWQANAVGNWGDSVYMAGSVSAGRYGDVTLTALWAGVQYYVQFNGNNSTSGLMLNQRMIYGESAALNRNEYVRNGYSFLGWATSGAATTPTYADGALVQDLSNSSDTTVTLFAVWEKSSYTITYDANGGEITAPGTTTYTITDTITLPTAVRRGFLAEGWRPQQNSGSWSTADTFTDYVNGSYGDVTLVAQWKEETYTITYDPAGGTLSGSYTTTYDVDTEIVLPTVTRNGYTFGGWQSSAAWGSVIVTDTAPANATGNVTLTAIWDQKTYYVRFNPSGGSGTMDDEQMRFDVSQALTPNAFNRPGYSFVGWATIDGGTLAYADGDSVINLTQTDGAIVNLYALWSARSFSIVYDLNGATGSLISTTVVMDGAAVTLRANTAAGEITVDGVRYAFAGWTYTKEDADNGVVTYKDRASFSLNSDVLSLADVDWAPSKPTITLHAVWLNASIELVPAEGSTTVIDRDRHFIYGLRDNITRSELVNDFLQVVGYGRIELSTGVVATGMKVYLISNFTDEVYETYEVVIFGDVNGDGMVNSTDVTKLRMINAGLDDSTFNNVFAFAGDLYADGNINQNDVTMLRMINANLRRYNQATRAFDD